MDKQNGNGATSNITSKSLWKKIKKVAKKVGKELILLVLPLWYCYLDDDTPVWAKTAIFGALAYFISIIDAIPDVFIPVGYADDGGVLAGAFKAVSMYVKPEHRKRAREWVDEFFGSEDDS